MSIYFDFKTINELTGDNYSRKPKEFTLEELSQYNGSNGNAAYVAIEGIVYDISNSTVWERGTDFGLIAGQDLTNQINSCNGVMDILTNASKVGTLIENDYMIDMNNMSYMNNMSSMRNMNFKHNMCMERQVSQDKSKFTPDDWIGYITPLVTYALREPSQGVNTQKLYQTVILMGVLVGLGKTPQEAINQVRDWQNTGASKILKSGTGTSGGMGAGFGTGSNQGAGFGTGGSTGSGVGTSGGAGTGGNTGTSFGGGTGGTTSSGAGTSGGMGTGGTAGTGLGGGTGGTTNSGAGTSGGMGTGGTAGTGFGGGTGGTTNSGAGTSGGMGTGGTGFGTGSSQRTGFGTSTVTSGNRNKISRLDLD